MPNLDLYFIPFNKAEVITTQARTRVGGVGGEQRQHSAAVWAGPLLCDWACTAAPLRLVVLGNGARGPADSLNGDNWPQK